jgi:hypothetical protein
MADTDIDAVRKQKKAEYLHVPIVLKSGSLSLLEPAGPVQACDGIALPLPIEEEIQYRTTLGNKPYYTDQFFFKSILVSKKSKLKLYRSTIRPTVTYACEAWVLKETIKTS